MSRGEICARLLPTGQPVRLRWQDGIVSEVNPTSTEAAGDRWAAPALVDLQVNGFAGVDFQQDDLSEVELWQAVAGLRASGCARFLLTLITDHWEPMLRRLRHLRTVRDRSPVLQHAIAGWHFEGPFLSSEPGFCGAHNPEVMLDPTLEQIRQLRQAAGSDPVLLTIAPERAGALEAIALAVSLGIRVSLGHTNASADTLRRAQAAGATAFTHFGNACPQHLDRHDNILWRVLDTPGLTVSLIPDGIHVSPPLFRLVHRVLPDTAIYYTTDAVAAAGAPPGLYSVGHHRVQVGPDQVVRQPGRTNYAGSALRPIDGVRRAAAMLERPWQAVWEMLSTRPAYLMGWPHAIAPGHPADFCIVRASERGGPILEGSVCLGQESPSQAAAEDEGGKPAG